MPLPVWLSFFLNTGIFPIENIRSSTRTGSIYEISNIYIYSIVSFRVDEKELVRLGRIVTSLENGRSVKSEPRVMLLDGEIIDGYLCSILLVTVILLLLCRCRLTPIYGFMFNTRF